ncbi:MAG: DEAD/DEAH box helicase [Lachnospiraceae bacterium]|nr:DEAD/DEAH box helicase [Lachnospiraceae bacterium]
MKFNQYDLEPEIIEALTMLGYVKPTPIQLEAIPEILLEKDIVGKSQTGSGKTAAFAIPICQMVDWNENAPQALILEPTRELAVQVKEEIFRIGRKKKLKVPVVFGGMPVDKQVLSLKQKAHIVVGTPGRVLDHVRRGSLKLDKIKYLVIDEADLMLDMGFATDVEFVLQSIKPAPVIMLFSATLGEHLTHLIEQYMKAPKIIIIESETETVESVEQIGYFIENDKKFKSLVNLMICDPPENSMVFSGTREMVNVLFRQLKKAGIRCGMLHGEMEQRERLRTIDEFRQGKFHCLITTDVASRGIDFENITHVFNYDFPTNKENYVHRIGRTGRNGKSGKAVSFIQNSEKKMLNAVEEFTGVKITITNLPDKEEIADKKTLFLKKQKEQIVLKAGKGAVFNKTIAKLSIGGGKKSKMRAGDIVGTICAIEGITQEDIGIIDVRDSLTYVEIFNGKGDIVLDALQDKTIKGKVRKVRKTRK